MEYTLGNGTGPIKKKKPKGPMTSEEAGEASRQQRLKRFTPKDNKKVQKTLDINNKTADQVKDGLKLNEYGLPAGEQQQKKKFKLGIPHMPKFRK
jgi:hypothetical protein